MAIVLYAQDAQWDEIRYMAAASIATNYMKTGTTVGSDAVEAGTTDTIITATGHAAQVGDEIIMTSGDEDGEAREVTAVATNTITLEAALSGTPSATETFNIIRSVQEPVGVGAKIVIFKNTLNQDVMISFDGSTDHILLEAGDDLVLDLKQCNLRLEEGDKSSEGFIYVKHNGTAPASGGLYISIAR